MSKARSGAAMWLIRVLLAAWLALTLVAAVGLYRLWFTREWRMYGGKSVDERRAALFAYVGLDAYLLHDAERIAGVLPRDAAYRTDGDRNRLSYVQYLLIPRTPVDAAAVAVRDTGSALVLEPAPLEPAPPSDPSREAARPLALVLAVGVVLAVGAGLRRLLARRVSMPQSVMLGLLAGMGAVTVSRAVLGTAVPGFILWATAGVAGACAMAAAMLRGRMSMPRFTLAPARSGLLMLGGAFVLWTLLMAVIVVPDDWDAWAMWGAKAKVLALGSGSLDAVARFGSPEYPLLWPSLWAFTGWMAGGWEEQWAKGWGAVLLAMTAWQVAVGVPRAPGTRGGAAACVPAMLFVTLPCVALVASWAYAEPAFWLALACAWSALVQLRAQPGGFAALLAGLLLAAAMYTKNEGAVFAVVAGAWLLAQRGVRASYKAATIATAAIAFLPWFWWTRFAHQLGTTSNGGFIGPADAVERMTSSLLPAAVKMLWVVLDLRLWGLGLVAVLLAAGWSVGRGSGCERRDLLVPASLGLVYAGVILFGENDPVWQVSVAWNRLTTHVLLLIILISGPRIAEAIARDPRSA